ncbi:NAD-dependent epimerase/dehydratase family protein [Desertihabitans brevis]|uniref:NAD-dependent epimerase/dehydratase family protein n=1 Tax=Desertihabitans brevis TaxID=2268447 RepID=UPI001313F726|nr:NAD-dependent epimerase/dehydratase family protein [Desertihabitans brevis]
MLVTGANGYLGTHTTAALLEQGHRVRAAVRTAERGAELQRDLRRAGVDPGGRLGWCPVRRPERAGQLVIRPWKR